MNNETRQAIIDGWRYECSCGEQFRTVDAARRCRKCRVYLDEGVCYEVVDLLPKALHLTEPVIVWQSEAYRKEKEQQARADRILRDGANVTFTVGDLVRYQLASE